MPISVNNENLEITFGPNSRIAQAYVQSAQQLEEALRQNSLQGTLIRIIDDFPYMLDTHFGEKVMSGFGPESVSESGRALREQKLIESIPQDGYTSLLDMCMYALTEYAAQYFEQRLNSSAMRLIKECVGLMSKKIPNMPEETAGQNLSSKLDRYTRVTEELVAIGSKAMKMAQAVENIKNIAYGLNSVTFIFQSRDGSSYDSSK